MCEEQLGCFIVWGWAKAGCLMWEGWNVARPEIALAADRPSEQCKSQRLKEGAKRRDA